MNKRNHSPVKLLSLGAMVTALTVLCLYASSILPVGRVLFLFLSSIFICVLTAEHAYATAVISYVASSILAFFVLPDKLWALLYALILGNYGILHAALKDHMQSRFLRSLIKLLYCDILAAIGIYLLYAVFMQTLPLPDNFPVWAIVLIAQAVFIAYDILYGASAAIYQAKFRSIINPRR